MADWSKEPWCVGRSDAFHVPIQQPIGGTTFLFANLKNDPRTGLFGNPNRARADAARAVQCVNALAGIADPAAALEKVKHALEKFLAYNDSSDDSDVDTMLMYADALQAARAALAALSAKEEHDGE